jgi:hypothetical protein
MVDDTPQALNETGGVEVEKQSQAFVHQLEVREQLSMQAAFPEFMGKARPINAFQQTWPKF